MWGKYMYGLLLDGFIMGLDCVSRQKHITFTIVYICLKICPDTQARYCHI